MLTWWYLAYQYEMVNNELNPTWARTFKYLKGYLIPVFFSNDFFYFTGENHAGEIASMSMNLLTAIKSFKVRHKPNESLKLRIGVHSGTENLRTIGKVNVELDET